MSEPSFYDRPDLYDLVMTPDPRAEAFYIEEARRRSGPILDLACGTGRVTLPLARAGLEVVGVDISAAMLDVARKRAAAAGQEIELLQADMRDLDLGERRFGLALIAHNSLLHLLDASDIRLWLRGLARALRPGGALAFDVFVPHPRFLGRPPGERRLVGRCAHETLGAITVEETSSYDPVLQIGRSMWFWSSSEQPDFFAAPLELRQLYPQELPLLLELEGFRLAERYGDFDRRAFGPGSPRQVCVCVRA